MRILHTEWSDGWGGQERRIVNEMAGLAARGHELWLVTRAQCRIRAEAERRGIPVLTLPLAGRADPRSIFPLARLLRRERIEIVNTHSGVDSWVGGLAARLARVPVLLRTRHLNLPLKRNWVNFVHYLPDRVITCGEAMRRQLIEHHGFPSRQVVSIPTGIDFAAFAPKRTRVETRRALGIADDAFLILMVGVIRGVKRHALAVQALHRLIPQLERARLVLAGDGPMRPDTKRLARELGIADKVYFLGQRDDVADLMGAADALLLTSRSEGVPQAVTQALGLGLPVIATAVGGVPELIEHQRTGLRVPPEDVEAITAALMRIARDPAGASRLGAQGREHVLAHFSLEAMLDKTEALLTGLLAEKTGNTR